jgi:MYXO-CTERM domain-containing protein
MSARALDRLKIGLAMFVALLAGGQLLAAEAAVAPYRSWSQLSWSNGYAPGIYDINARRVVSFRDHIYAHFDESTNTRSLMFDLYFGVRTGGQNIWLTEVPIVEAGYDSDTGIVRIVQEWQSLRITQSFFGPFDVDGAAMVAVAEVENTGSSSLTDAALFSIQNLHIGDGSDGSGNERAQWLDGAFEERGPAGGVIVHRPIPAPTAHAATPQNPWQLVTAGGRLVDVSDSGVTSDVVPGFEWDLTGLAPGEMQSGSVIVAFDGTGSRQAIDSALAPLDTLATGSALVAAAREDWSAFHARARQPEALSDSELAVYRQSLAVLRMAQVREPAPAGGQIVASLPPGMWNIAWVRDQAYAIEGLLDAGLTDEARAALSFMLDGDAGDYVCCDDSGGPYVGRQYALSVTRYYGNGSEESDWNADGPNVEFDGFGLILRSLARYAADTGDTTLISAHSLEIFDRTADVLVSLIEPETGLIRADSSIWETHWENGGRRHHTYTQATSVAGLRAAAVLADLVGAPYSDRAASYRQTADELAQAITDKLVHAESKVLRSSLEEQSFYLDAAAVEAFNWGVIPADGEVANSTLDAFRDGLWNSLVDRGYRRNDDGGSYDQREWVICDLRIAAAARRADRHEHADELLAWVTDQARENFNLVPENFDRVTGAFEGEVPMAGFGAGVYITATWERELLSGGDTIPSSDAGPIGSDSGIGGSAEGPSGGCGCRASGTGSSPWLLMVVLAALCRRRR